MQGGGGVTAVAGALEDLTEQPSETWSFEDSQKPEIKTLGAGSQLGNMRLCLQTLASSSEVFSLTQPFFILKGLR